MPVSTDLLSSFILFAQAQGAGQDGGAGTASMLITFLPLVVLFYFVFLRPQQQQEKKRLQTINALKKNDRVVTLSGIYGTVVSVDASADRVVLRVDDDKGVKIAFTKSAIARVVDPSAEKDKEMDKAAETAQKS